MSVRTESRMLNNVVLESVRISYLASLSSATEENHSFSFPEGDIHLLGGSL